MLNFFTGAVFMAFVTIGLAFLKFWFQSRDRFFSIFSSAFFMLALERFILVYLGTPNGEGRAAIYTIRLVAFIFIIIAIVDKNRKTAQQEKEPETFVN